MLLKKVICLTDNFIDYIDVDTENNVQNYLHKYFELGLAEETKQSSWNAINSKFQAESK